MQCDKGCTLIALSPIQRTTLLDLTLNRNLRFDSQPRASQVSFSFSGQASVGISPNFRKHSQEMNS